MWSLSCFGMSSLSSVGSHFRWDACTWIQLWLIVDDFGLLQYVEYYPFKNIGSLMRHGQPWSSPLHLKLRCDVTNFLFACLNHTTHMDSSSRATRTRRRWTCHLERGIHRTSAGILLISIFPGPYFYTVREVHRVTNLFIVNPLFFPWRLVAAFWCTA